MTGRELLRAALRRHLADPRGVLVGEAVGCHGVTEGFPQGDNLLRSPLSENATIGIATGLALAGRRPVVEILDPAGLDRAADALEDLATLRARSGGTWSAPVVIRAPFADVRVPDGIAVAVAATPADLVGLLGHALAGDAPVVILEAASALDGAGGVEPVPGIGTAVVRRAGGAVTALAVGDGVGTALSAADGLDVEVLDLRALAPLDAVAIGRSVRRTGRAVAVGAPGALLVALREAFLHLESPLASVASDAALVARELRASIQY